MKKLILFAVLLTALPLSLAAQDDDMYFVPTKKKAAQAKAAYAPSSDTYYSGSSRSVDEYNRWGGGSHYEPIAGDSAMADVIDFSGEQGVYPDSVADFQLTRQMARWDGYTPTDAYWEGYDRGRSDEWRASMWHSPWYYSSYYPWYDSYWYDPWYYSSWHYGWYDPWYYGPYYGYYGWGGYYGSWHRPYYYGGGWGGSVRHTGGKTYAGTHNHSYGGRTATGRSWSRMGNSRSVAAGRQSTAGTRTTTSRSGSTGRSWGMGNPSSGTSSNSSWGMGNARSSSSSSSSGSWSSGSSSSRSSSSSSSMGSSSRSSGGSFGGSRGGSIGRSGGRR